MTAYAKMPPAPHRAPREVTQQGGMAKHRAARFRAALMEEQFEDVRLNAIADERAAGPFISVSLDDL